VPDAEQVWEWENKLYQKIVQLMSRHTSIFRGNGYSPRIDNWISLLSDVDQEFKRNMWLVYGRVLAIKISISTAV